ncbi:hypothetical protein RSAG8_12060, partial [Rhizoctonia solani AG-8 WAC10335]
MDILILPTSTRHHHTPRSIATSHETNTRFSARRLQKQETSFRCLNWHGAKSDTVTCMVGERVSEELGLDIWDLESENAAKSNTIT